MGRSNSEAESSDGEEAVVSLGQSSESNESNSEVEDADGEEDEAEDLVIGSVNGAGQFCGISLGRPSAGKEKPFWRPWETSENCNQYESMEEMEAPAEYPLQYMAGDYLKRGEELSEYSNNMGATAQTQEKRLALRKNTRVWPVLYPTPAPT